MRLHHFARVLTSWIAVLAVLMAALAPLVSHALAAQSGASWIDICRSGQTKWVQADGSASDKAPASGDAHPFEHCPYCSLHAHADALPAAPVTLSLVPSLFATIPTAFLSAPRTPHAWLSAQPRAPPQRS
jgi:hypothetical protein